MYGSTSRKIKIYFFVFRYGSCWGLHITPRHIQHSSLKNIWVEKYYDLPVEFMLSLEVAKGRQKVEDCRHLVDFSVDEVHRTLDAPGLELFPWLFLGLFSCLEKF